MTGVQTCALPISRDLAEAFGEAISLADEPVLLPIYPARETPIEGVVSEMLRSEKHPEGFPVIQRDDLTDWIATHWHQADQSDRILVTAGAGDIDQLYPTIRKRLLTA